MALKIPQGSSGSNGKVVPLSSSSVILGDVPNVTEFLLSVSPEGTLLRQPGSIQVFVEGGKFKARLKDREEKVYCFVSASSLDDLLLAVNAGLEDGSLDWRPDTEGQFVKGRK